MLAVDTFETISEADRAMTARSRYLGGGTLVMRDVNYGNDGFDRLVRCVDPELGRIRLENDMFVIGAGVTMARILAFPDLHFLAPVARSIGGPAIRNMASLGGNLFSRPPYGDFATALLALEARVQLANGTESDLESLLAGHSRTRGLVRAVAIPRPGPGEFRFRKMSRVRPKGVAVMTIAARLPMHLGRVSKARIAFGSMGTCAGRARTVEAALEGATLDNRGIAGALDAIGNDISPVDDSLATAWYRREVAPIQLSRLLLDGRH